MENGVLVAGINFPGWSEVPIEAELQRRLGCPVRLMMDATAAAAGEYAAGGHEERGNLFVLTLGTGVGGAAVLGGRIYAGAPGFMRTSTSVAGIEARGFLEHAASAPALLRLANAAAGEERWPAPDDVCTAAHGGSTAALRAFASVGTEVGRAAAALAHALLLDRVIVGGGVAGATNLLLDPAAVAFYADLIPGLRDKCDLVLSRLGNSANVIGAALVAQQMVLSGAAERGIAL